MDDGDVVVPKTVVAEDKFYEFDSDEKVSGDRERDEDEFCFFLHRDDITRNLKWTRLCLMLIIRVRVPQIYSSK